MTTDVAGLVSVPLEAGRTNGVSQHVRGSAGAAVAEEVRERRRLGRQVWDLAARDLAPQEFPLPEPLRQETVRALEAGFTHNAPAAGVWACREAIRDHVSRFSGVRYPVESVLVGAGARSLLHTAFRTLVETGDAVVYPVPSWNHDHDLTLAGGLAVEVGSRAEDGFFPVLEYLLPHLRTARLVLLNSPLRGQGAVSAEQALERLSRAILEENARRQREGRPGLFLVYDQVFSALSREPVPVPPAVVPAVARWTVLLDGMSKAFAASGLRVGWALGPTDVVARMQTLLERMGTWAPHAEQVATARFLSRPAEVLAALGRVQEGVHRRLQALHQGLQRLARRGVPVDALPTTGSIHMPVRFNVVGKRTRDGTVLRTPEAIRRFLLEQADLAVLPLADFGLPQEPTWFRGSVGAVSVAALQELWPRLEVALSSLSA